MSEKTKRVFPVFNGPFHKKPRGEFPKHGDRVFPVLTAAQAREIARERLEKWRCEHEQRDVL